MSFFIPKNNAVTILHHKSNDGDETAIYPITLYSRIINAPRCTDNINKCYGAEFLLFKNTTEEVTDNTYSRMVGNANFIY